VMTRKCPTCGGDGIVLSEASAAIDVERRLRALVAGSRSQAYRVELAAPIASTLVGPGARRLLELEALTKRRFFLEGKPDMHLDHFVVLAEGKLTDLTPPSPVAEGAELQIELVEVDRHDAAAAVGKVDGLDVVVGDAAKLVGKRVKVRVERVLDGTAYAAMTRKTKTVEPLTAEAEAEKPTRKPPARRDAEAEAETDEVEVETGPIDEIEVDTAGEAEVEEDDEVEETEAPGEPAAAPAKKKTRRGSRGGRNRKKPATTIHLPPDDLGETPAGEQARPEPGSAAGETRAGEEAPSENGEAPRRKKTRRGSRGGKNRRKRATGQTEAATSDNGSEPSREPAPVAETSATEQEEWGYIPMSEWGEELSE